jgi:hypothetical protein
MDTIRLLGGRLGGFSCLWGGLSCGLQLGDALGHSHDDGVFSLQFTPEELNLIPIGFYLLAVGLGKFVCHASVMPLVMPFTSAVPLRLVGVQPHIDCAIDAFVFDGVALYALAYGTCTVSCQLCRLSCRRQALSRRGHASVHAGVEPCHASSVGHLQAKV